MFPSEFPFPVGRHSTPLPCWGGGAEKNTVYLTEINDNDVYQTLTSSRRLRAEARAKAVIPACWGSMSSVNFSFTSAPASHASCNCRHTHQTNTAFLFKHSFNSLFSRITCRGDSKWRSGRPQDVSPLTMDNLRSDDQKCIWSPPTFEFWDCHLWWSRCLTLNGERKWVKQCCGQIMTGEQDAKKEKNEGNWHSPNVWSPPNFSDMVVPMGNNET